MNKKTSKWAALAAVPLLLAVSDRADAALTLSDGSTVAILNPAGTSGTPVKPGTNGADVRMIDDSWQNQNGHYPFYRNSSILAGVEYANWVKAFTTPASVNPISRILIPGTYDGRGSGIDGAQTLKIELWQGPVGTGTLVYSATGNPTNSNQYATPVNNVDNERGWVEFLFASPIGIAPSTTYHFVMRGIDGDSSHDDASLRMGLNTTNNSPGFRYVWEGTPFSGAVASIVVDVIPEPASTGVLVLGVLTVLIRRGRRGV